MVTLIFTFLSLFNIMIGQTTSTMQLQVFMNKTSISGDAYDAGEYSNPSGFGFDFIFGSQFAGLLGLNVSFMNSSNEFEDGGYLMHVPLGIQYTFNKWKYNPYLKASYSIISAYNSEYTEITDSWDWGSSTIGGDFVGTSFIFGIGYNWKVKNWFGIGVEIGYGMSSYTGLRFMKETYDLPSKPSGSEIYFRIPVIFLGT